MKSKGAGTGVNPSPMMDRQWMAEDDCRTLQRAEEIRADKQRMAGATNHAKKQMNALSKVAGKARGKK